MQETLVLIPGLEKAPGEGNGNPLQYCCLENPVDRAAWWAAVHGVAKSLTRLSDFPFTFHFNSFYLSVLIYNTGIKIILIPFLYRVVEIKNNFRST